MGSWPSISISAPLLLLRRMAPWRTCDLGCCSLFLWRRRVHDSLKVHDCKSQEQKSKVSFHLFLAMAPATVCPRHAHHSTHTNTASSSHSALVPFGLIPEIHGYPFYSSSKVHDLYRPPHFSLPSFASEPLGLLCSTLGLNHLGRILRFLFMILRLHELPGHPFRTLPPGETPDLPEFRSIEGR